MKVKGVRLYGVKDIRLEEFEIPEIAEDEILLKIECNGIAVSTLKEITLATDGNLGGQLSKLEECGAIFINKEFVKRKPQTTYELTDVGRTAFKEYVDLLDRIIRKSEADKQ